MEFVAATMLLSKFDPLAAFVTTLMVNARHLFYGISMLEKYNVKGFRKIYLIYGMCDESFSINCSVDAPEGVDKGWFMFFVTLFDQAYWVFGATLGGLLGNLITFDTKGLDLRYDSPVHSHLHRPLHGTPCPPPRTAGTGAYDAVSGDLRQR